jgi:chemotaxis protein methyltransferase CheR
MNLLVEKMLNWKNYKTEDIEVDLLLHALKERYGYDFTGYARASLKRRLLELTSFFDIKHLSELLASVLYDENVAQKVISSISVSTSDFFRDAFVWKILRNNLLIQLDSFPRINIWQVGCGYGEEVYSLVILLHEAGLLKKTRIFSTDINPIFLETARNGSWSVRHLASWERNYQLSGGETDFKHYFTIENQTLIIKEQLKESIEFIQHNLVVDEVFKEVQWVICRNVLIYFGFDLQDKVLNLFTRSLERGGYLLLGRSEKIMDCEQKNLNLELLDDSIQLYRKIIRNKNV